LCVPDKFIVALGNYVPPTCVAGGGDEGRCLHVAIPEVANEKASLVQSTCEAYERCTPCYDPRTLKDTGACKLSCDPGPTKPAPTGPPHGPPYITPNKSPECAEDGQAHCVPPSLVPSSMASQVAKCSSGLCVPDVFLANAGQYIPQRCNSIGDAEGRCLHQSIPKVSEQSFLPQDVCEDYEKCAPCFNPIDGSDTRACKLSCDPGPRY